MFTIRRAQLSDAVSLPAIEISAGAAFLDVPGLEWIATDPVTTADEHRRRINDGAIWVAEDRTDRNDRLVGFISCEITQSDMHIWELSVHTAAQRVGLGRRLIQTAIDHARATNRAAVSLTTFNDVAFNAPFYNRLGFTIVDPADLDPRLDLILENEAKSGLPAARRCAMRMTL